MVKKNC